MTKKLNLNFSHVFTGAVWNMMADENGDYLAFEVRDHEAHKAHFAAVDLINKKIVWEGLNLEERWWVNIQAVQNQAILFYVFDENIDPERRELMVVDIRSREILWHKKDISYVLSWEDKLLCTSGPKEEKQFLQVNFRSGEPASMDAEQAQKIISGHSDVAKNKNPIPPLHYPAGNQHFETFKNFLGERLNVDIVSACDYLAFKELVIISYYIYSQDSPGSESKNMANYLLVVDENSSILFHEKIQEQITAIGLETFFILNNQLFFVRNKREIISYEL